MAGAVGQKEPDPGNQIVIDPCASVVGGEDPRVDIVEATLNIQEKRGDFVTRLKGTDRVGESRIVVERG